jgi:hypothetical protein
MPFVPVLAQVIDPQPEQFPWASQVSQPLKIVVTSACVQVELISIVVVARLEEQVAESGLKVDENTGNTPFAYVADALVKFIVTHDCPVMGSFLRYGPNTEVTRY